MQLSSPLSRTEGEGSIPSRSGFRTVSEEGNTSQDKIKILTFVSIFAATLPPCLQTPYSDSGKRASGVGFYFTGLKKVDVNA